jgi:hypothetical protein
MFKINYRRKLRLTLSKIGEPLVPRNIVHEIMSFYIGQISSIKANGLTIGSGINVEMDIYDDNSHVEIVKELERRGYIVNSGVVLQYSL